MLNWKNKFSLRGVNYLVAIAIVCSILSGNVLNAQNRINSPYSMFGPGEVRGNSLFQNMSMGGVAQGFRSNVTVNHVNPASYTATDSLSFIFDAVIFSHMYRQKFQGNQQMSNYSMIGNINFAFPVTRFWGIAAGLLPFSQSGYNISEFSDTHEGVKFTYQGRGGINQVYLGHGFRLLPNLSVGINASYLFGRTEDNTLVASNSVGFYSSTWSVADEIDGFMFTYGIQWHQELRNGSRINVGATYTPNTNLNISRNSFQISELPGVTFPDTLTHTISEPGKMLIPARVAAGVFMDLNNEWSIGVDYETQFWSNFESKGVSGDLSDSYMARFGTIFNPQFTTYANVFGRLEYRAGIRYGKSFLNIDNQAFNEFGISFGIGIPVRRSLSGINIGFEYSTRAADSPELIEEDFFRVNIGLNIHERWFARRRFF